MAGLTVWGVDPSTIRVSTAVCGLGGDGWVVDSFGVEAAGASGRYRVIVGRGVGFYRALAERFPPEEVWVEQPSGAFRNPSLLYAVGAVLAAIQTAVPGVPTYTVPPSSWKLAVFGKGNGNAGKPFIMEWARSLGYRGAVQDEADALGVGHGGRQLTGKARGVLLAP